MKTPVYYIAYIITYQLRKINIRKKKKVANNQNYLLTNRNSSDTIQIVDKSQQKMKGGEDMPKLDYSKLKGRILEKGLNQKELASKIGISEGQFCKKLSGEYVFKQSEIVRICEVLNIENNLIGDYFFTT